MASFSFLHFKKQYSLCVFSWIQQKVFFFHLIWASICLSFLRQLLQTQNCGDLTYYRISLCLLSPYLTTHKLRQRCILRFPITETTWRKYTSLSLFLNHEIKSFLDSISSKQQMIFCLWIYLSSLAHPREFVADLENCSPRRHNYKS